MFLLEMVLKLTGLGYKKYFEDSFNRFDFVLSWIGLAEFLMQGTSLNNVLKSARTVRTFRIVRVLRVVKLVRYDFELVSGKFVDHDSGKLSCMKSHNEHIFPKCKQRSSCLV